MIYDIPPGSVLGPILFIFYVNEFSNVSPILKSVLFADGTTVSVSGPHFNSLCDTMNTELAKIYSWSTSNRLSINGQKTSAVVFSNRYQYIDFGNARTLKGGEGEFVNSVKFVWIVS